MNNPQYPLPSPESVADDLGKAQKISEKRAKELCKATQRGTVPRLGRFLAVTLETGEMVLLKRVTPRRYVLLYLL